jgi:Mn2+/Fe2+ NRAMP family transporter
VTGRAPEAAPGHSRTGGWIDVVATTVLALAAAAAAEANRDIQRANDYVLGVVLFSVALFFAGISSRLGAPLARAVILGVGCTVLLGTIAWMATFPISLST